MNFESCLAVTAISCFVLLFTRVESVQKSRQNVIVSMDARWSSSILQEASDFMANENKRMFWSFLDEFYTMGVNFDDNTDRDIYNAILDSAKSLLSPSRLNFLKFALALRAHSPAVEMQRQMGMDFLTKYDDQGAEIEENFVDFNGKLIFSLEVLENELKSLKSKSIKKAETSPTFDLDVHFNESLPIELPTVILYANLHTKLAWKMHQILKEASQTETPTIDYVFRHFSNDQDDQQQYRRVKLSGYGVELAIKSTEYKAQDDSKIKGSESSSPIEDVEEETDLKGFNIKRLKELYPELKDNLNDFKLHLLESDELTPLKVWQLQDLSFQAGQHILDSSTAQEAIQNLLDVNQNFPILARSLLKHTVKSELRSEVETNQVQIFDDLELRPGDSALYINGLHIDFDSKDAFQLLDLMKNEDRLATGFFRMGFNRGYLELLSGLDMRSDDDNYAVDYRNAYPEYINDLDSDRQYKDWGSEVRLMIQPYFPGMIRPIARNFFTLIFIIDPAAAESRNLLKIAQSFYVHQIPIRIGLVFVVNQDKKTKNGFNDAGVAILNAFNFVKTDKNAVKALRFITEFFDSVEETDIQALDVTNFFKKKYPGEDFDLIFGFDTDYDKGRQLGSTFLNDSGLGLTPKVLLNGIPLDDSGISTDQFEETVINQIMKITPKIQRDIIDGKLTDKNNVAEFLLNKPDVMPRLNGRILKAKNSVYLDFTDITEYKHQTVDQFFQLNKLAKNQFVVENMKYFKSNDDTPVLPVSVFIISDLTTDDGIELFLNGLKSLKRCRKSRFGLLPNFNLKNQDLTPIFRYLYAAVTSLSDHQAKNVALKILSPEIRQKILYDATFQPKDLGIHGISWSTFEKTLNLIPENLFKIFQIYVRDVLNFSPGQSGVVANGQILGPLESSEVLTADDFQLLEKHHFSRLASNVAQQIKKWKVEDEKSNDMIMRICSLLSTDQTKKTRRWIHAHTDHSAISLPSIDETRPIFDILAIVDPLSPDAQRLIPWFQILLNVVNVDFKLLLNCKPKLSEMPLKNFYRFVLSSELEFTEEGSLKFGPMARFSFLPRKQLLTLNLIEPNSWMVESKKAVHDLDNIKMGEVDGDVVALFELEYLLLEGHCFDEVTGNPPRGLQFTLGTQRRPVFVDTIVMANLGYFQLKANPGAYILKLNEGRSSELYDITSHENTDSKARNFLDILIMMNSFSGRTIRIKVTKKPDKLNEHLLIDSKDTEEQSMWNTLTTTFTGNYEIEKATEINIFSLASGHLYERLLRIMMLSVMKHAKLPVKFWLLKNYLSPDFKEFLPRFANRYNFSYELVQYKWPRWLHHETVKQRLMWGYKILFLDVLFPLDVKKIIFVDADQVVRANMQELMDFDLEGAPYGYTPFCDSRKEMEGYRFWKRGYWASHLGNRKYHISALYVVDLKKFRQIAAGDRLRGQYQGLSADSNSLSNLDQDLPNNMIFQVKIKSLPQEWLWCETWCDNASKNAAKTIDLCNNPQTKEPKLESGMRIIAEWNDYDKEIRNFKEMSLANEILPEMKTKRKSTTNLGKPDDSKQEL